MGTIQSTPRSSHVGATSSQKGRPSFSKEQRHYYPQYSNNGQKPTSTLHPSPKQQHTKQLYGSSPPSSHTSQSSVQRAFGRRRSSNQTVDSLPSSLGSTFASNSNGSIHQSDQYQTRHSGEATHGQRTDDQDSRWMYGRRYHNTSSLYMLPNDTEEVDRLHLQHYIFKLVTNDKNIHVPMPKDHGRIADLGCGPATWTMDMATEHTSIDFVGVDISSIFPQAIHPRNCSFYKEDILQGISQPDKSFDVVYQRNVTSGFTFEHWQRSIQEAYRLVKPGGWFESVESDVEVQEAGPFTSLCFDYLKLSMASRGVDTSVVRSLAKIMTAVGFTEVQVKEFYVPLGEWGDKKGMLWKQNLVSILETVTPLLAKSSAGRLNETQMAEVVQNMANETHMYRAYQTIYVTIGRKPVSCQK
ncbi:hypothetical protein BGZ76_009022 [Entomortierella beljakovae]|nr:hypothetical protein BGZ76_009022 [Entomortierella beljakovae]